MSQPKAKGTALVGLETAVRDGETALEALRREAERLGITDAEPLIEVDGVER